MVSAAYKKTIRRVAISGLPDDLSVQLKQRPFVMAWCRWALIDCLTKQRIIAPGTYERLPTRYKMRGGGWSRPTNLSIYIAGYGAPTLDRRLRRYAARLGFDSYPLFVHHTISAYLVNQW
jgi:hypothetical protein